MSSVPSTMPRSPGWSLLMLAAFTVAAALWFVSPWFPLASLAALQRASDGWLSVTLVASTLIGGTQVLIVLTAGRQRLRNVGWQAGALPLALLSLCGLWLLMQLSSAAAAWSQGQPLVLDDAWARGLGIALGPLLAQLVGTALMEETVFRGYLWPQLALRLRARMGPRAALWSGLLASQAAFALLHIPIRLHGGAGAGELAIMLATLFVFGLVFALIYAATGNVLVAVAVHALGNAPTMLVAPAGPAPTLVLLAGALLLSLLHWQWRRNRPPNGAGPGAELPSAPSAVVASA